MSSSKLKLNDDKTEAMIVSSQRMSTSLPMPDYLKIGTSNVMFSQSVETLGMMLDTHLTMKNQVKYLVRIRHCLSVEATLKIVLAFVMSTLDCSYSFLCGCLQYLTSESSKQCCAPYLKGS